MKQCKDKKGNWEKEEMKVHEIGLKVRMKKWIEKQMRVC